MKTFAVLSWNTPQLADLDVNYLFILALKLHFPKTPQSPSAPPPTPRPCPCKYSVFCSFFNCVFVTIAVCFVLFFTVLWGTNKCFIQTLVWPWKYSKAKQWIYDYVELWHLRLYAKWACLSKEIYSNRFSWNHLWELITAPDGHVCEPMYMHTINMWQRLLSPCLINTRTWPNTDCKLKCWNSVTA